jgi:uncharacterized protein YndB with AHSA1/START domain
VAEATAVASIVVDASPKVVWKALTDPELIRQYFMGATVDTDWKEGSPITFRGEWNGTAFEDKGEVLTVRPQKELRYSHWSPMGGTPDSPENYHVVDIELHKAGSKTPKTEVRLTQSNLSGAVTDADRAQRGEFEKNWRAVLQGLKDVVERN